MILLLISFIGWEAYNLIENQTASSFFQWKNHRRRRGGLSINLRMPEVPAWPLSSRHMI